MLIVCEVATCGGIEICILLLLFSDTDDIANVEAESDREHIIESSGYVTCKWDVMLLLVNCVGALHLCASSGKFCDRKVWCLMWHFAAVT